MIQFSKCGRVIHRECNSSSILFFTKTRQIIAQNNFSRNVVLNHHQCYNTF